MRFIAKMFIVIVPPTLKPAIEVRNAIVPILHKKLIYQDP